MTETQYVVLFVIAAVIAVTVLAVGTLGAADLLPERRGVRTREREDRRS